MIEELFIVVNYERKRLDLNTPSGITLDFISTLFNNMDKVTSSYSYSFNLPLTRNNRECFEMAEDIRTAGNIFRKKIEIEYHLDGLPIITEGYLYINNIGNSYNCAMTWDVVKSLALISKNNVNLPDLEKFTDYTKAHTPSSAIQYFGEAEFGRPLHGGESRLDEYITDLNTDKNYLNPVYEAGVQAIGKWNRTNGTLNREIKKYSYKDKVLAKLDRPETYAEALPPPVVPIRKIFQRINSFYRLNLTLPEALTGEAAINSDLFNRLAVPLVSTVMSNAYAETMVIKNVELEGYEKHKEKEGKDDVTYYYLRFKYKFFGSKFIIIDRVGGIGYIRPVRTRLQLTFRGSLSVQVESVSSLPESPKLTICQKQKKKDSKDYEVVELASVEPSTRSGVAASNMVFDFDDLNGSSVTINDYEVEPYEIQGLSFRFNFEPKRGLSGTFDVAPNYIEGDSETHAVDIGRNLPNISVLDFIKSVYYLTGGLPRERGGVITNAKYSDLERNREEGNVYDWSKKVLEEEYNMTFGTGGSVAQKNYYLMGNENEPSSVDPDAIYEHSMNDKYEENAMCISIQSEMLDLKKTVFKSPFYAKYILNGDHQRAATGNSIKYYDVDSKWILSASLSQPAIGQFVKKEVPGQQPFLTWEVVSFKDVWEESYAYAEKMFLDYTQITIHLHLDITDLLDIDYTKPVYIQKYNSYFAIGELTLSVGTGITEAKLIKLPN